MNNRLVANPMEPRVAVGEYDAADGQHTLYTTSQNPHVIRLLMGAFVLGIPENKLRVVAPDVGGGFGSKIYHYAEEAFVTFAAKAVGRPVKWVSTRSEAFMSDAHGRDHVTKIELALDARGQVPGGAHRYAGQHGGVSVDLCALHADLSARHADGGALCDAADLRERAGGVHQHRAGRRLSRRGAAGGDFPARAGDRQGGARDGDRPDRDAADELHQARAVPVPDAGRGDL